MKITFRPAVRADQAAVVGLLTSTFPQRPKGQWSKLFDYPWLASPPDYGMLAEQQGEVVGYMGAIYSDRVLRGRPTRICGMTSWCVGNDQQGSGIGTRIADAYLEHMAARGCPVLLLSVGEHVRDFFLRRGSRAFREFRHVFYAVPTPSSVLPPLRPTRVDPARIREDEVGPAAYGIVRDHLDLQCTVRCLRVDACCLAVITRKRSVRVARPRWLTRMVGESRRGRSAIGRWLERARDLARGSVSSTEILYVSDPAVFRRHRRAIAVSLAAADGTVALSGSSALLGLPPLSGDPRLNDYMCWGLPEGVDPMDLDPLYSELVLLGL